MFKMHTEILVLKIQFFFFFFGTKYKFLDVKIWIFVFQSWQVCKWILAIYDENLPLEQEKKKQNLLLTFIHAVNFFLLLDIIL